MIYLLIFFKTKISTPTDLRPKSDERFNISIFLSHNLSSTNSENNELDGIKEQNVTVKESNYYSYLGRRIGTHKYFRVFNIKARLHW